MKVHVMDMNPATGICRIIMHAQVPAGNNAVGKSWQQVLVAAGLNKTEMVTGNGDGQISTSEANQIAAGSVVEFTGNFGYNASETLAQNNARLSATADNMIANGIAELRSRLNLFGHTIA